MRTLPGSIRLDFAVVGGQRSGSTFLTDWLGAQPDIFLPYLELPVFEDPYYVGAHFDVLAKYYRKSVVGQARGIKRPDYLGRSEVPERLRRHNPDMRIVAVLRDPIERLLSGLKWYMYVGFIPVADIAVYGEIIRSHVVQGRTEELPRDGSDFLPRLLECVRYSTYGRSLSNYLAEFPSEQVYVSFADNLYADPSQEVQRVCRFLEVSMPFPEVMARRNPSPQTLLELESLRGRLAYTHPWEDTEQFRYKRSRWLEYPWDTLNLAVARMRARAASSIAPPAEESAVDFSAGVRRALVSFFADDLAVLSRHVPIPPNWMERYGLSVKKVQGEA